ncbi:MAG TPA: WD40 repeat domain-containing protein, partial [Chthoniobacteraceae bacterium]|nr:WD40 repeat domain-containing protein [Chthoniobacteraceae bacterium]
VAILEGHVQQVTKLTFHPSGSLLLSGGWEGVFRMWEPSSGRQVLQFQHRLSSVSFSTDGSWAGAIQNEKGGQLLEIATCPEYRTLASSLGTAQKDFFDGGISPDGRWLAMGTDEGVHVWEIITGREAAVLAIGRTGSAFFPPNGRELLTCGDAGLQRWPIQDRADAAQPLQLGPPQQIALPFIPTRACQSRDGSLFVATSEPSGRALVLNSATGAEQASSVNPSACYVALSPDGTWLATAGWHSPFLRLSNVRTGELTHEWNSDSLAGISFTPDSRTLVVLRPEECSFWDLKTLQPTRRLRRDAPRYGSQVAFSPDEKLMALEVVPGVIHLTEAATGRTVAKLTDPFGDRATWMSFTPDGTQLVTASKYDKTIHVWNLRRIRAGLKEMRLDWDWPEFSASDPIIGR